MPNIKIHYQESSEPSPKTDTSHQRTERAMPQTNTSETNVSESDRPAPGPYSWSFSGDHWQSFPNSSSRGLDCGGHYSLVRGPEGEKDHVEIDLVFSPPLNSSYTFHGTADFRPKDGTAMEWAERGQFEIQGTGTITNMTDGGQICGQFWESLFQIVEGSGKNGLLGISGAGILVVETGESRDADVPPDYDSRFEQSLVGGSLIFERVNDVGAILL
ncbi:MAG: hypothetical protein Q9204_002578 [Flavoplaca sp. TL-2023a]